MKCVFNKKNKVDPILKSLKEKLALIKVVNLKSYSDTMLYEFSQALINKTRNGIPVNNLMVDAFALVHEAIYRVLGMEAFDVQIMAAIALHEGKLVEMQTGEGKTLVAVFPAYLNALDGMGVHILTVNDYLARRDAAWMGEIYRFLGLTVGFIQEGMPKCERQKAYNCDITYVTAKEAGFDFLRDSLVCEQKELVHRPFHYVIVDEADSIMIDEARIPLVIAVETDEKKDTYGDIFKAIDMLKQKIDYNIDDSSRNIYLTNAGIEKVEKLLNCGNIYDARNEDLISKIHHALHAKVLLKRDVDYIVNNNKIELVDEFTGRIAEKRHWPDGLQAAVEASEGLEPDSKGRILGSITMQNFIHLYPKISGMTGTAKSSSDEFMDFYGLDTIMIPTNKPCIRVDHPDVIFACKEAKYKALLDDVKSVHDLGRPVLIGTCSITESERIALMLNGVGISCQVLNAKNDELEAQIIANSGMLYAVTVSTNMSGRGTDIKLGGENGLDRDNILALGGLYVIGTNRHESVRIDNQLRGRAGRQGDPGSTRFFISLEDDLLVKFGIDRIVRLDRHFLNQDAPLDRPSVMKGILHAQHIIEGQNYDIRKTLWKYSNIIEIQRQHMYGKRMNVLEDTFPTDILQTNDPSLYVQLSSKIGQYHLRKIERDLTLYCMDRCWADYLEHVSYIRDGIHLVMVAGQNPLEEYLLEVSQSFKEFQISIESRIMDAFKNIKVTDDGIDVGIKDLKGPSATWTYLVNDNPFEDDLGLMLASTRNIGFAAFAASVPWISPVMLISLIYQRFIKRNRHIN
jgi:Preprotein translocase subunit SecA (ATPase, RNA helicase)